MESRNIITFSYDKPGSDPKEDRVDDRVRE